MKRIVTLIAIAFITTSAFAQGNLKQSGTLGNNSNCPYDFECRIMDFSTGILGNWISAANAVAPQTARLIGPLTGSNYYWAFRVKQGTTVIQTVYLSTSATTGLTPIIVSGCNTYATRYLYFDQVSGVPANVGIVVRD